MKRFIASVPLAIALFTFPAWSGSLQTSAENASAAADIRQLGQDLGDAMIALDVETLDRIIGDEWVTVGPTGSIYTKAALLSDTKAGKRKLVWFELRPMDVQVFGNVAIAQGNVAEKRMHDGRETHVELVYSDILRKRDGRWVIVRSMGANVGW